jgi:hypothetical protein
MPDSDKGKPLGNKSKGPLIWDQGMIAPSWRNFQPKMLCSSDGIHMIVSPCDPGWWANREAALDSTTGYQFKTAAGEFVIEASEDASKRVGSKSKLTTIAKKANGQTVAQFKDATNLAFDDGASFILKRKGGIPPLSQSRSEFYDKTGGLQFRTDRKKDIWLTDQTDRNHVLFLIALERFLKELD